MEHIFNTLLLYGAIHFIGDFAYQSTWMAMNKGKDWEVLLYHCLTYTAPFVIVASLLGTPTAAVSAIIIFVSHFAIDTCSARLKWIKTIWGDQLWHLSVLTFLVGVGYL